MDAGATSLSSKSPSFPILTRLSLPTARHGQLFFAQRYRSLRFNPITCSSSDSSNTNDDAGNGVPDSVQPPSTVTPPGAVGVRFRRRSRRQSRQQREDGAASRSVQSTKANPKKWEDMSLTEKAIELYVGEKGMLFWLNKFAYASIFIMIGAWIAFRFLGPALNLYQLDSPPLSPTSIFKQSS